MKVKKKKKCMKLNSLIRTHIKIPGFITSKIHSFQGTFIDGAPSKLRIIHTLQTLRNCFICFQKWRPEVFINSSRQSRGREGYKFDLYWSKTSSVLIVLIQQKRENRLDRSISICNLLSVCSANKRYRMEWKYVAYLIEVTSMLEPKLSEWRWEDADLSDVCASIMDP